MNKRPRQVKPAPENCRLGGPLIILEEAGSTNDIVKQRAEAGASEGLTVVADRQTTGRGRMGRSWLSLKGRGLYMSVLLRPGWPVSDLPAISMLSALAVASALERAGVACVALKWPNDVLADRRKIAGILVEQDTSAGMINYCVVGIGINLHYSERDLVQAGGKPSTSCRMEGVKIDRDSMFALVIREMDKLYRHAAAKDRSWITREWAKWSRRKDEVIDRIG